MGFLSDSVMLKSLRDSGLTPDEVGQALSLNRSFSDQSEQYGNLTPVDGVSKVIALGGATPTLGGEVVGKDDERILYIGGNRIETWSEFSPGVGFRSSMSLTRTNGDSRAIGSCVQFRTDADQFEYKSYQQGVQMRLVVNGEFMGEYSGDAVDGTVKYVLVDLSGLDGVNDVRLEFSSRSPFGGIVLPVGGRLFFPSPNGKSLGIFGDSFTEGTGLGSLTRISNGWAAVCAKRLGFNNYAMSGFGGTGYLKSNSGAFRPSLADRVDDDVFGYDCIIIAMGINDDEADISSEITDILRRIRSNNPNTPVVALGSWGDGAGNNIKPLVEMSIIAASQRVDGVEYVQVFDIEFSKSDATHPDEQGHKDLGVEVSNRISNAIS